VETPRIIRRRQLQISPANPNVEFVGFLLETAFPGRIFIPLPPFRDPPAGYGRWAVQEERQMRLQRPGCYAVEFLNSRRIQPSTKSLVREGGVQESIGQNPYSGSEGRPDDFPDVLVPIGEHQKNFSPWRHPTAGNGAEQSADNGSYGGSSGFPGGQRGNVPHPECFEKHGDLSGFSGTFDSFERNEQIPLPYTNLEILAESSGRRHTGNPEITISHGPCPGKGNEAFQDPKREDVRCSSGGKRSSPNNRLRGMKRSFPSDS